MNGYSLRALIGKDLKLHYSNKFILVITALSVIIFCVIYFVLPADIDETFEIGILGTLPPSMLEMLGEEEEGLVFRSFSTPEEMTEAITDGELLAGISFPEGWALSIMQQKKPEIELYFASDTPEEMVDVVELLLSEIAFELSGQTLRNVTWEASFIGEDMAGIQIPYRERMKPLIAIFVLLMEIFGLGGLISDEVERRTAEALLVTPLTVSSVFIAKAILGTLLAFIQAAIVMVVIGGFSRGPLIILTALFLGAVMATAVSFIAASLGKDFISVVMSGMPFLLLLVIPGFSLVTPGAVAPWVRYIPSYFLADTVFRVQLLDAGWADVWSNLVILLGANVVLVALGILVLRRKFV
ncbi:MAG: ABC transporter permease [Spirochaetales bacterium]|nr:ABC transporter permease [Spirochaetales bacterium]